MTCEDCLKAYHMIVDSLGLDETHHSTNLYCTLNLSRDTTKLLELTSTAKCSKTRWDDIRTTLARFLTRSSDTRNMSINNIDKSGSRLNKLTCSVSLLDNNEYFKIYFDQDLYRSLTSLANTSSLDELQLKLTLLG